MSISIENLSHVYMPGTPWEKIALRDISLEILERECIGIAGRAGSGKTTLIQHLNGLLRPTTGCVRVNGIDTAGGSLRDLRKSVGLVFQYPERQFFEETVLREVAFGLSGSGMDIAEIHARVAETLHDVGLGEEFFHASPFALSAGQKRRVAVAGVLVMRPEVLVLDEPAAGLDPEGRREIFDILARLHKERGLTLVLVSHDMGDLARMADRVVVLKEGEVARHGTTREVFRDLRVLEEAGLAAPPITCFMMKLRKALPEIQECILTVEEAREELRRIREKRCVDHRDDHGEILPRDVTCPQVRPEDEAGRDTHFHDPRLSGAELPGPSAPSAVHADRCQKRGAFTEPVIEGA